MCAMCAACAAIRVPQKGTAAMLSETGIAHTRCCRTRDAGLRHQFRSPLYCKKPDSGTTSTWQSAVRDWHKNVLKNNCLVTRHSCRNLRLNSLRSVVAALSDDALLSLACRTDFRRALHCQSASRKQPTNQRPSLHQARPFFFHLCISFFSFFCTVFLFFFIFFIVSVFSSCDTLVLLPIAQR